MDRLSLRIIAPYGSRTKPNDPTAVLEWYRAMVVEGNEWMAEGQGWRIDTEDSKNTQYFGRAINLVRSMMDIQTWNMLTFQLSDFGEKEEVHQYLNKRQEKLLIKHIQIISKNTTNYTFNR